MIQLLFVLGIVVLSITAVFGVLSVIPSVLALLTFVTDEPDEIIKYINNLISLIESYAEPWVGLMNRILGITPKRILVSLIVWMIIKPFVYKIIDLTTGLARKILERI